MRKPILLSSMIAIPIGLIMITWSWMRLGGTEQDLQNLLPDLGKEIFGAGLVALLVALVEAFWRVYDLQRQKKLGIRRSQENSVSES